MEYSVSSVCGDTLYTEVYKLMQWLDLSYIYVYIHILVNVNAERRFADLAWIKCDLGRWNFPYSAKFFL